MKNRIVFTVTGKDFSEAEVRAMQDAIVNAAKPHNVRRLKTELQNEQELMNSCDQGASCCLFDRDGLTECTRGQSRS